MSGSPPTSEPLPHAPIGMVLGLVEHLRETPGGREDLYQLGRPMGYELDDLLPVTEAAKRLGLVTVAAGDIELTAEGRRVAEADEGERRHVLAARLRTLPLLAAIGDAIGRHGRAARQELLDALAPHFSPSEAERQLATAVDWARYGELFDFDADAEEFFVPVRER